jgi:hypothetical protein
MTTSLLTPGANPPVTDITEKRVHDDDTGATEVIVAAKIGVVSVSVSAGQVGRFGVTHRCSPRDVAAGEGRLAVATDADVLIREDEGFVATGFGPAVAVGTRKGAVLAADADGTIARLEHGGAWTDLGSIDTRVLAIDGSLLATGGGVYRIRGEGGDTTVEPAGLETANDVAARGPYVATDEGVHALGNGWTEAIEGEFGSVAAASRERACAAGWGDESGWIVYDRGEAGWRTVDLSTDRSIVDVALKAEPYAITEDGTLFVGPEWRSRSLGIGGVVGITVVFPGSRTRP